MQNTGDKQTLKWNQVMQLITYNLGIEGVMSNKSNFLLMWIIFLCLPLKIRDFYSNKINL